MAAYISEYNQKRALSELGYRFDGNKVTPRQAVIYTTISNRIRELERRDAKKNKR